MENKCRILESKKVFTLLPKIIRVTSNQLHHVKAINFDIPYHLFTHRVDKETKILLMRVTLTTKYVLRLNTIYILTLIIKRLTLLTILFFC